MASLLFLITAMNVLAAALALWLTAILMRRTGR